MKQIKSWSPYGRHKSIVELNDEEKSMDEEEILDLVFPHRIKQFGGKVKKQPDDTFEVTVWID